MVVTVLATDSATTRPRLVPGVRPHQPVADRPGPRRRSPSGVFGVLVGHRGVRQRHHPLLAGRRPAPAPLPRAARSLVVGALALVVGEVLTFACFFSARPSCRAGRPRRHLGQPGVLRARGPVRRLPGPARAARSGPRRDHPPHRRRHRGLRRRHLPAARPAPAAARGPGRYTPLQILANSVAAVAPPSGQVSPAVGFVLMVLYCAVALAIGAVLFAPA